MGEVNDDGVKCASPQTLLKRVINLHYKYDNILFVTRQYLCSASVHSQKTTKNTQKMKTSILQENVNMPQLVILFFFLYPPADGKNKKKKLNPFRAPDPLSRLNPSNFVPKNGFPVVKGLSSPHFHVFSSASCVDLTQVPSRFNIF